jgi:hypothetical protein
MAILLTWRNFEGVQQRYHRQRAEDQPSAKGTLPLKSASAKDRAFCGTASPPPNALTAARCCSSAGGALFATTA